jgi:hypothetical protein
LNKPFDGILTVPFLGSESGGLDYEYATLSHSAPGQPNESTLDTGRQR